MISQTGPFAHFRRKNSRRLRSHYRINFRAAENGAIRVFVPHPMLINVKAESVSGHFRLSVMTRTVLIEWFKHFSIDHKRVWVASSSRFFFYSAPDLNERTFIPSLMEEKSRLIKNI